jgi:sodium-dependent dicarboxylate transporter 2/3/5
MTETTEEPAVEAISPAEAAFERWRKIVGAAAAPLAFLVTLYLTHGHLTTQGSRLSAVLALVCVLWVSEALPLPATALLGAVLSILLGVAPAKTVLAYFADPIVFLFMGSFMLARAMTIHGLDRRMALAVLSVPWVGEHPARVLAGIGFVTGFISMWVSNTATTAMMLPIGLGILGALHQVRVANGLASGPMDARNWPFATGMMLMIAYSASVGGLGTPVGTPPNLIGIVLIRQTLHVDISFFRWMRLAVPMLAVMGAVLFVLLYALHPAPRDAGRGGAAGVTLLDYLAAERERLGPWTAGQRNTLIAFAVAICLWVLPGVLALPVFSVGQRAIDVFNARAGEAVVALVAALLLFILPTDWRNGEFTLTWPDAVKIDWGTILLFGGGLSLGTLMFETGVARALGTSITSWAGPSSLWTMTAISIAFAIVLSEATSNTTSATMIIPVVIALAQTAGVSPLPPALGACLGASYGFMLPVSTPPNAIVYGTGLVPIPRMIRAGILFDVIGFVVILVGLRVLCPVLGLL